MVTLAPLGKLVGGALGELRRGIEKARRNHRAVAIDLSEVTLVDRHSISFLVSQEGQDLVLINCPDYLEPWMERARKSAVPGRFNPQL
ncbi:MAG: hypothetical protein JO307_10600 [Bryobacterales bacterium]|nr:hypothetical protein [Bryobacterales bacterium]MBV9398450.1 hypothetical protein [Bryobacterales bacterium]